MRHIRLDAPSGHVTIDCNQLNLGLQFSWQSKRRIQQSLCKCFPVSSCNRELGKNSLHYPKASQQQIYHSEILTVVKLRRCLCNHSASEMFYYYFTDISWMQHFYIHSRFVIGRSRSADRPRSLSNSATFFLGSVCGIRCNTVGEG